jgi:hypothetical protein
MGNWLRTAWRSQLIPFLLIGWALWVGTDASSNATDAGLQSKRTAEQAAQLSLVQVHERARNIRENCQDQNERSRRAKERLRRLAAGAPAERVAATVSLIDALAPEQNCAALVKRQTRESAKEARP